MPDEFERSFYIFCQVSGEILIHSRAISVLVQKKDKYYVS